MQKNFEITQMHAQTQLIAERGYFPKQMTDTQTQAIMEHSHGIKTATDRLHTRVAYVVLRGMTS